MTNESLEKNSKVNSTRSKKLSKQDLISEQGGKNLQIIKRAGSNKSKQGGKNVQNN